MTCQTQKQRTQGLIFNLSLVLYFFCSHPPILHSPIPLDPLQSLPLFILLLNQGWSRDGVFKNSSGPGHVWRELLSNQGEPMLLFYCIYLPVGQYEGVGHSSFSCIFFLEFEWKNSWVSSMSWISTSCVKKKNNKKTSCSLSIMSHNKAANLGWCVL